LVAEADDHDPAAVVAAGTDRRIQIVRTAGAIVFVQLVFSDEPHGLGEQLGAPTNRVQPA
jgi:hypothetical protein